jgi:histidine phosphotransferase ChpT
MKDDELVSMLCSRLCHDLVGPISAVANGVEVLQQDDDADMRDAAVELLAHSAELAANRIKFYRVAFGASGGEGVMISLTDARDTVADFLKDTRVTMRWSDESIDDSAGLSKVGLKLLLNLILIASESMPRGGEVEITISADGDRVKVAVSAKAERLALSDIATAAFAGGELPDDIPAKAAPVLLAANLADVAGTTVVSEASGDTLTLTAHPVRKAA